METLKQSDRDAIVNQFLAQLAAGAGGPGVRRKAVSSTPTSYYGHGVTGAQPGGVAGLFSFPGLEPDIMNAMVLPRLGLLDLLPSRTSIYDNPLYGIMTGVTATTGSEPTGVCDDPPVAGLMKLCTHAFVWGRMSRMTRVIDIDRAGRFINRSDFNDLTLIGNPLVGNDNVPQQPGNSSPALAVRSEAAKVLFELSTAWARDFATILYDGSPSANTAGGGYKEPYGLDILINDGYRDAETGVACPAADSIMMDFANLAVESNAGALVVNITSIFRNLRYNASHMGLDPVQWVLAMPWSLFYQITEVWPCAYATYRCTTIGDNNRGVVDIMAQNQMRDDMRGDLYTGTGQYLLIDGQKVPVVLDDGIAETVRPGSSFSASIYFVPLRVLGNRPVTFLEYVDYEGPLGAMEMARALAPAGSYYTTNNGRFLWHTKPPTNFCVQSLAKTEWRVILETPQIAARLDNVVYAPAGAGQHRSWDPANSSYYVNGGATNRGSGGPSYYGPTA
jgi:hypothetical protein